LPHGHCTECQARVTVRNGRCLLGHRIDPATIANTRGRRLATKQRSAHDPVKRHRKPQAVSDLASMAPDQAHRPPIFAQPTSSPVNGEASSLAPTGTLVMELWQSGGEALPIEGWEIGGFDEDRRSATRWLVRGAFTLALVAGLLALIWYVAGWRGLQLQAGTEAVTEVATDLDQASDELAGVIEDLGDGRIDNPGLAATAVGNVNATARALFDTAAELPTDSSLRGATLTVAQQALDIESAIGDAVAYGTAFSLVAEPPEFHTPDSQEDIPTIAAGIAWWVGRFVDGAASLPKHPLLDEHRLSVSAFAGTLESWQASYLDALRRGDAEAAEKYRIELESGLDSLVEAWASAAGDVSAWGASAIEVLEGRLKNLNQAG